METHTAIKPKAKEVEVMGEVVVKEVPKVDWARIYGRAAAMRAQELRDARDSRRSDWD